VRAPSQPPTAHKSGRHSGRGGYQPSTGGDPYTTRTPPPLSRLELSASRQHIKHEEDDHQTVQNDEEYVRYSTHKKQRLQSHMHHGQQSSGHSPHYRRRPAESGNTPLKEGIVNSTIPQGSGRRSRVSPSTYHMRSRKPHNYNQYNENQT
jgi:hypothetical protein